MISYMNKLMYPSTALIAANSAPTTLAPFNEPSSETQSEISSADSDWSDVRSIAVKLGVTNPDDLHTERFKIDRQKLEQMIKAECSVEGMNGAEYFFESVMKTCEAYISWPRRLKIGAKNKKDPHVRIVGKVEEVAKAKELIIAQLQSKDSRVIMKMDVSYTDHSYIIGRGGNNIRHIMKDTSTHIHFPDSNRSNPSEKSNQVSLCGSIAGVEKARSSVRLSTPLLISFELPVMAPGRPLPNRETPYVTMVEQKYNVQVIFSSRQRLHTTLVLVKGSEKEAEKVQEATETLINLSCGNLANQILVNVQLEISPPHQEIVKGKNNKNLLSIMERTNTKIIFPDLSDMNVKPLKKSQVIITGTIDNVYKARQQLLGNLPIALMFDYPENQNKALEIMNLSTKYGVHITLRQKQRQSTLAIVIKGLEKFIDKVYEARHEILGLTTPMVKPVIPETYYMPKDKDFSLLYRTGLTSLLAGHMGSFKTPNILPVKYLPMSSHGNNNNLLLNEEHNSSNNSSSINNNDNSCNQNFSQLNRQPLDGLHSSTTSGICSPTKNFLHIHNNTYSIKSEQQQLPQPNSIGNYMQIMQHHQQHLQSQKIQQQIQAHSNLPQQQQQSMQTIQNASPRNSYSNNTSGYQSFSSSTTSLEQAYPPFGNTLPFTTNGGNARASGPPFIPPNRTFTYSPDSNYGSEVSCNRLGRRSSDGVLLGLNASGPAGPSISDTSEHFRNLNYDPKNNHIFDFDFKRVMGFKAMDRPPVAGEVRTPTPNWVGMGLSRTSPVPIQTVDDSIPWRRDPAGAGILASPYSLGATTSIVDATSASRRSQLSHYKDIHSLLTALGLEHYIKIFVLNEIDLDIFITLTEQNLIELGIAAFGARKKLLTAIHTLQANAAAISTMPSSTSNISPPRFSGSAAPGAERRPSNKW